MCIEKLLQHVLGNCYQVNEYDIFYTFLHSLTSVGKLILSIPLE